MTATIYGRCVVCLAPRPGAAFVTCGAAACQRAAVRLDDLDLEADGYRPDVTGACQCAVCRAARAD